MSSSSVTSGSISIFTTDPGSMCAITVPSTVVWMSAFENSIPNARPAAPSAKMPDSAPASDSTFPDATTFAVLRASIRAPCATVTWANASAFVTASESATCAAPGFGVLASSRAVDELIFAMAVAPAVTTAAAPACRTAPVSISTTALAFACAYPMLNRLPDAAPLASAPAVAYRPSVSLLSSCASCLIVIVAVELFTSTFTGSAVRPSTSPQGASRNSPTPASPRGRPRGSCPPPAR